MCRSAVVPWLIVALVLAGCCHNPHAHGGKLITEHEPGSACEQPERTPYKALYALYRWDRPPEPPPQTWVADRQVTELFVRGLARGEPIGFKKGPDGELLAVAGTETIKLEDGRYCWHITTDSEYTGGQRLVHEIGDTVTAIVAMPCGIVLFALTLPVLTVVFLGWGVFALGAAVLGG